MSASYPLRRINAYSGYQYRAAQLVQCLPILRRSPSPGSNDPRPVGRRKPVALAGGVFGHGGPGLALTSRTPSASFVSYHTGALRMTTMGKAMRFPRGRKRYATLPRTGPFTEPQPGTRISAGATTRPRLARAPLLLLLLSLLAPPALAQPKIDPPDTYLEVTRRLEPWLAAELQQKGIPALSIALVDDQKIVWARGFRVRRCRQANSGHRQYRLPRRLGLQALHRPGRHAARRAGQARSRQAGLGRMCRSLLPRTRSRADHTSSTDVAPIGTGARAAGRTLLRPGRAGADRSGREPRGTTLVFEPGTRTKYSNAGDHRRRRGRRESRRRAVSRPRSITLCSSRWACLTRASSQALSCKPSWPME